MPSRFVQPLALVWDDECDFCRRWVRRLKRLDWFRRIHPVGYSQVKEAPPDWVAGWTPELGRQAMWIKALNGRKTYMGYEAFRRMAWVAPPLWPALPLLYVPPVPQVGRRIYHWVARNRHQWGCGSSSCQL